MYVHNTFMVRVVNVVRITWWVSGRQSHKLFSFLTMQFSLRCVKYDRHGYKARNRALIMTNKGCYLVDVSNFKLKESFTFEEIQSILVSKLTDGIILIRLPSEGPNARGDLILQTDRVIELVLKLGLYGNKLPNVEVFNSTT